MGLFLPITIAHYPYDLQQCPRPVHFKEGQDQLVSFRKHSIGDDVWIQRHREKNRARSQMRRILIFNHSRPGVAEAIAVKCYWNKVFILPVYWQFRGAGYSHWPGISLELWTVAESEGFLQKQIRFSSHESIKKEKRKMPVIKLEFQSGVTWLRNFIQKEFQQRETRRKSWQHVPTNLFLSEKLLFFSKLIF